MTSSGRLVLYGCIAATIWAGPTVASAAAIKLLPHRAVYDLRVMPGEGSGAFDSLNSRLVYEFSGAPCAGYTVTQRFMVVGKHDNGQRAIWDNRVQSWEASDGSRFSFNISQFNDQQLQELSKGMAVRGDDKLRIHLKSPQQRDIELSKQVYFPTQHVAQLLKAAQSGVTNLQTIIYDGAEGGGVTYETSALIGRSRIVKAEKEATLADGLLSGMPAWPISIAYFANVPEESSGEAHAPIAPSSEQVPDYHYSFWLYSNGVGSRLRFEYDGTSFAGSLQELTVLSGPACD